MLGPQRSDLIRPLVIRRAGTADAAAIARVYVDSWRGAYRGQLPDSYLAKLDYAAFERHWRQTFAARGWAFVAAEGDRVIGIASGGRARRQNLASGEIYVLYVLAEQHGRGIGRALFDACHFELAKRGHAGTLVWVLASNPARHFYEHLGGIRVAENTLSVGGTRVREVGYLWRD
jgi:ribosomal protein S18 acetylase RimI-like enzyme